MGSIDNEGVKCGNCGKVQSAAGMAMQVENRIRAHINRYYENTLVCSDCEVRTRMMGVYGRRCVSKVGCRGEMRPEVSRDETLLNRNPADTLSSAVLGLAALQPATLLRFLV
jgi:hypothetical protein